MSDTTWMKKLRERMRRYQQRVKEDDNLSREISICKAVEIYIYIYIYIKLNFFFDRGMTIYF